MSLGFFAKFVINFIWDIFSIILSSPTLIVILIVSPTFAEIFVMSVSLTSKTNVSSELIDTVTSS